MIRPAVLLSIFLSTSALAGGLFVAGDKGAPGGKWSVIGGNISEGDYIHRSLFLLNQKDGSIRTIAAKSAVLTKDQLRTMDSASIDAVGESKVQWLSDDALLIDSNLVIPGKGLINLGGEVAN